MKEAQFWVFDNLCHCHIGHVCGGNSKFVRGSINIVCKLKILFVEVHGLHLTRHHHHHYVHNTKILYYGQKLKFLILMCRHKNYHYQRANSSI